MNKERKRELSIKYDDVMRWPTSIVLSSEQSVVICENSGLVSVAEYSEI